MKTNLLSPDWAIFTGMSVYHPFCVVSLTFYPWWSWKMKVIVEPSLGLELTFKLEVRPPPIHPWQWLQCNILFLGLISKLMSPCKASFLMFVSNPPTHSGNVSCGNSVGKMGHISLAKINTWNSVFMPSAAEKSRWYRQIKMEYKNLNATC